MDIDKERKALEEITNLIELASKNDRKTLLRYSNKTASIFYDYKSFAKALFKGDDLQFVPLYITTEIGIKAFGITRTDYRDYLEFIYEHQALYKELHDVLRKMYFKEEGRHEEYYDELIKRILLEEADKYKGPPINLNTLLKTIYDRVYAFPYIPDTNDMYNFFIRNIPGQTIRTKHQVNKQSNQDNSYKSLELIPWKSRLKANVFMDKRHWTDTQKEIARNRLQSNYFDVKANKKYQLHLVAPRHTFIIDLFFPGRFVYLLAINVNTRKAYAIPSPLITQINGFRWRVPQTGHKTVGNVLKMVQQLLAQTPIKMIYCDYEPAFVSNEFKAICNRQGITLNTYQINNIEGMIETNNGKRAVHGALSILDRLCRTIRNMAFNIGILNQDIDPDVMNYLINEYNNSPHNTFFRIFKRPITPNEMDNDNTLEDRLCYQLSKRNFVIRNSSEYSIRCPVRVMNNAAMFDKLKHKLLPGIFTIEGQEGGLFICKQGDTILKVPRWMIIPATL